MGNILSKIHSQSNVKDDAIIHCSTVHDRKERPTEWSHWLQATGRWSLSPLYLPSHRAPASSECGQLKTSSFCSHSDNASSIPLQLTSWIRTRWFSGAAGLYNVPLRVLLAAPQFSSRHTTATSVKSQPSSHTVPHWPLSSSSTRPSQRWGPPISRTLGGDSAKRRDTSQRPQRSKSVLGVINSHFGSIYRWQTAWGNCSQTRRGKGTSGYVYDLNRTHLRNAISRHTCTDILYQIVDDKEAGWRLGRDFRPSSGQNERTSKCLLSIS